MFELYQEDKAQYSQILQVMRDKMSLSGTDRYGEEITGYFHEHGQDYLTALNLIAATKPSSRTEVIEWSSSAEQVATDTDSANYSLSDDQESSESLALESLLPPCSSGRYIPAAQSTHNQPNSPFHSSQSPSLFALCSSGSPMLLATPSPIAQETPTRLSPPHRPSPLKPLTSERLMLRTSTICLFTSTSQNEPSKLNPPSVLCQDDENDDRQLHKPLLDDEPNDLLDDDDDVVTLRF